MFPAVVYEGYKLVRRFSRGNFVNSVVFAHGIGGRIPAVDIIAILTQL